MQAMNPLKHPTPRNDRGDDGCEWLSALADGECPDEYLDEALQSYARDGGTRQSWGEYQLVGQALRGGSEFGGRIASADFVAGVMSRIASEVAEVAEAEPAVAAGLARSAQVASPGTRSPAANDAVFRWKVVAGVASLAAVAALAWQVAVPERAGPVLAQGGTRAAPVPLVVADGADLAVRTSQGVVLRDPQLEALMAAHRQFGSVSALQAPAGFLRNATYDVPQR